MNHAAKPTATHDARGGFGRAQHFGLGRREVPDPMRPMTVVVINEDAQKLSYQLVEGSLGARLGSHNPRPSVKVQAATDQVRYDLGANAVIFTSPMIMAGRRQLTPNLP